MDEKFCETINLLFLPLNQLFMKHISFFILCLFSLKIAVAQTDPTLDALTVKQADVLHKQDKDFAWVLSQKEMLNERIRTHHEQAMRADAHFRPDKVNAKATSRSTLDTDDDGMPDDWETLYGFNPTNPADAFGDYDLDRVMNLFEFQLGTSPNDPSTPSSVNVSSNEDLAEVLASAQDQTVFRVQGGEYPLNYISFDLGSDPLPRIAIQGGWNETFTERDICQYPSILDGQQLDEIFQVGVSQGENAIIFDGLTFRNGKGTYGSLKFTSWFHPVTAYWSIVDCEIAQNAPIGGFGGAINFLHWDSSLVQVTLINAVVTDNNNTCG
ncbi:MAG TPA: hypothetical protein PK228_21255, partial [Saprospiraceae bacterium]|nr:hypothetical protein [Saprospiraceae bacterium]